MIPGKGGTYIGFDIGGTNIRGGLVDSQGRLNTLLEERTRKESLEEFFSQIGSLYKKLCSLVLLDGVKGVGFGFPGFIDLKSTVVERSPNLPILNGINLKEKLSSEIDVPFFIENDANAAAIAEAHLGWGKGGKSFFLLTIGTGLGGGLVLSGRIWHGIRGYAGEIGHITVDPNGFPCSCGNRGCLETVVSGSGIVKRVGYYLDKGEYSALLNVEGELTAEIVYQYAKEGDPVARKVLDEVGRTLGIVIANILNCLNLELIVLAGKVMRAAEFLLPPALSEVEARAIPGALSSAEIKVSKLGNEVGVLGAALVAREALSQEDSR